MNKITSSKKIISLCSRIFILIFFLVGKNCPSAMVIQSPQTCISTPLLGKEKGGLFNGFGQTVIFADFAQKKGKEEIQKNYSEEVLIKVKFLSHTIRHTQLWIIYPQADRSD